MKFIVPAIPVAAILAAVGVGCQTSAKKPGASPLDVTPSASSASSTATPIYNGTPSYSSTPAYTAPTSPSSPAAGYTPPAQPQFTEPVVAAGDPVPAAGTSYTVQKGDTLFKIAKSRYGDGNKWKLIASANPGVNPSGLRVGQRLAMP